MLALYLLAAHLVGDFVFQNRWQAIGKHQSRRIRLQHCVFYTVPFWPLVAVYGRHPWWHGAAFAVALLVLHFATDSRRYLSTIGDVAQWRIDLYRDPATMKRIWLEHVVADASRGSIRPMDVSDEVTRWPTPNPWPPTAFAIDQTLHICQLAILGGLFLS